jgi:hypothetical protein
LRVIDQCLVIIKNRLEHTGTHFVQRRKCLDDFIEYTSKSFTFVFLSRDAAGAENAPSVEPQSVSKESSTLEASNMPPSKASDEASTADLTLTIVPIIVIVGAAPLIGLLVWMLRRRYANKKEAAPDSTVRYKTSSAPSAPVGFQFNK